MLVSQRRGIKRRSNWWVRYGVVNVVLVSMYLYARVARAEIHPVGLGIQEPLRAPSLYHP